ncbi:hypothetical protein [Nocardia brasiliensis]|uniref:hypothetical protein n=1 Tax=Nocardia brasiliensis TaxID=37326 RepID=UPI00114D25BF|nr:hypothetical protein [Nocardia brasiliensis]
MAVLGTFLSVAVLCAGPAVAEDVVPGPVLGEVATGSAAGVAQESVTTGGAAPQHGVSPDPGAAGTRSADPQFGETGSADPQFGETGSAATGIELALEPPTPPSVGRPLELEAVAEVGDEIGVDPAELATPALLGLEAGSAAPCAGSSTVSSGATVLGLATGSALIGPGMIGPGSSGSAIGSAVVGSSATGLGSAALGSSGSALGGSVVGGLLSGSAATSCLLAIPAGSPPIPAFPPLLIPLSLEPSVPGVPAPVPVAAPMAAPAPPPAVPVAVVPYSPVEIIPDPFGWDTLELVTFLVVIVLVSSASSAAAARKRKP